MIQIIVKHDFLNHHQNRKLVSNFKNTRSQLNASQIVSTRPGHEGTNFENYVIQPITICHVLHKQTVRSHYTIVFFFKKKLSLIFSSLIDFMLSRNLETPSPPPPPQKKIVLNGGQLEQRRWLLLRRCCSV